MKDNVSGNFKTLLIKIHFLLSICYITDHHPVENLFPLVALSFFIYYSLQNWSSLLVVYMSCYSFDEQTVVKIIWENYTLLVANLNEFHWIHNWFLEPYEIKLFFEKHITFDWAYPPRHSYVIAELPQFYHIWITIFKQLRFHFRLYYTIKLYYVPAFTLYHRNVTDSQKFYKNDFVWTV